MKFFIVLACVLAVVAANEDANVLRNDAEVNPDSFKYAYELDNHVKADQHGVLEGHDNWVVGGAYEWISPEGEHVSVHYTADEHGYHPESAHLPTSPPIPEAIARSIAYIQAHPSHDHDH